MIQRILLLAPQIKDLYLKKYSTAYISSVLHINKKTVLKVLLKEGIEIRKSKQNLLGEKFGRLTVIAAESSDKSQKGQWKCLCDCGNTKVVRSGDLKQQKITSCGCKRNELSSLNLIKYRESHPIHHNFKGCGDLTGKYLSSIKYNALIRKFEYNVTPEELWELFLNQKGRCALSSVEIGFKSPQTASLDRIDSSKGYVISNVQWVHKIVNNMKQDLDEKDFFNWCSEISKTMKIRLDNGAKND